MPGVVAKQSAQNKNARRRAVKKAQKAQSKTSEEPETQDAVDTADAVAETSASSNVTSSTRSQKAKAEIPDVTNSYDEFLDISESDPLYAQFKDVFKKFSEPEEDSTRDGQKPEVFYDEDDEIPDDEEDVKPKMSKKKRKAQSKLSIAELKALVSKPELVEWTDPSAADPRLLVAIKAQRNVVPVPSHWSLKREYLSSKRGVEKPAFALPKFIQDTGIAEMRDAVLEKQENASLKQKQRERVQPKMGKLDIDYQRLYEAFFHHQTKPVLTRYGEVYYEGKEYETNLRHLRPGELSDELKDALSIPPGAPPPWLINMQRFGPPPSYSALKIPGLNAPLPPGAQWGFHPGGFGKPPVDEFQRPLYGGDIFGTALPQQSHQTGEPVQRTLWGELQPAEESEEEEEEEEDDEEEPDEEDVASGTQTASGFKSSGIISVDPSVGGTETPADFTLRKQRHGTETEDYPRSAGQVIAERNVQAEGFFGSDRAYDLRAAQGARNLPVLGQEENTRKRKVGDVDVSVDVDALERDDKLSKEEVHKHYDTQRQAQANPWGSQQESLEDMIAQESRKRQRKDEERRNRR